MSIRKFARLMTLVGFMVSQPVAGQFSCYQCNLDVWFDGLSTDCTDPYVPSPADHLLPCPHQNETHHCLKAEISYNHFDLTVRACVPSRTMNGYCAADSFAGIFPGAKISCHYCEDEACNRSIPGAEPFRELTFGLVAFALLNSRDVVTGW